jgi:hypothetical protein
MLLAGTAFTGPKKMMLWAWSWCWLGGKGSLNKKRGSAKLMKALRILPTSTLSKYLMISMPTAPTIMAVVVARAGMILPAMSLT